MAKESFRFIHASDFHLERPMQDIYDLPEHLRQALVDAPWKAAESVFEHAILENVDFILLSGDLLNLNTAGAQGAAFLLDQFELLKQRGIEVYWAGGEVDDPDRWPEAVALPSNVHVFSRDQVESFVFRRNQVPLATILGRSNDGSETVRAAEFAHEPDDNYVVAVAYGSADSETLRSERVDYWALGGRHQAEILQTEEPIIRYSGSPQARQLSEEGSHGFVLVDVDAQRCIQVHTIESDVFRYSEQDVDADDFALGRDVRQMLAKRVARLQSEANGRSLLVKWRMEMDLENASMVGPSALEELLGWLRREYGQATPACWSTDIEVLPPKELPSKWKDEDTVLGDFLRIAAEQGKAGKPFNLKPIVEAETPGTSVWHEMLGVSNVQSQNAALPKSTLLGVDLLRGHKVDLVASTRRFGGTEK
ncbi:MAG: exonuclease SbcCD subunit D [Pirellulaceae bacterium]